MSDNTDMLELCHHAVSVGEKNSADEVEAIWTQEISSSIKAQLGQIDEASMITRENMRIRLTKDKAVSSVVTYSTDKTHVEQAVLQALRAARASKKDVHWNSLPSPGKYPTVDVWDPAMEDITSQELMELVTEMLQELPEDISAFLAFNELDLYRRVCVNTKGIEHSDKGSLDVVGLMVTGRVEGGVTPAFQKLVFQREYNLDPKKIANFQVERVNLFKKKETAVSGKSPIIFAPYALENLLRFTLFKAVSGENVARGKSLLAGKEDQQVASSHLTLYDSGIIPQGPNSREMDDEGVPCQKTPLVEEGILKGFIWNDYWAKRTGATSTGNAHYDDSSDEVTIQQNTMVITPGSHTKEELFDVPEGYLICGLQGAHSSNPESGDFSVMCTPAFKVKKGEIVGGVTGMMLSDNVFSLLKKIDALGCEPEVNEITYMPHVRFTQVNVAAK